MESIQKAADDLKRMITEKVAALKNSPEMLSMLKMKGTLNSLEQLLETEETTFAQLFDLDTEGGGSTGFPISLRFDQFVGKDQLEASKAYLDLCRDARTLDEIIKAIEFGGAKVTSRDKLEQSLTRSTLDIVKIGSRYGAIKNYPNVKRGRGGRRPGVIGATDVTAEQGDITEETDLAEETNQPEEKA